MYDNTKYTHTRIQDASGVRCGDRSASVRARARACVFVSARQIERTSRARERSAKPVRTEREEELHYDSRSRKYSYYSLKTDLLQAQHVREEYIILEFSSLRARKVSVEKKHRDLSQGLLN